MLLATSLALGPYMLFNRRLLLGKKLTKSIKENYTRRKDYNIMGKRVVRSSCFETNSSSQHSIIITKNDEHIDSSKIVYSNSDNYPSDTVYIDRNGKLSLYIENGYGREPFQILTTFKDKLQYAMCEYLGYYYGDEPEFTSTYNMFVDIVKDIIPGFKDFNIHKRDLDMYLDDDGDPILWSKLRYTHTDHDDGKKEHYQYKDSEGNLKDAILSENMIYEVPKIGCIDHQSSGLLKNFIKDQNIDLAEFLTNKKYAIVITGDEYDDWPLLKASGIIDMSFIVEEYDTSGEDIEYAEWLKQQGDRDENS